MAAVTGLEAILQTLELVKARARGAVLRKMQIAGNQVLLKTMKAGAPQVLKKALGRKEMVKDGVGIGIVGPKTNFPIDEILIKYRYGSRIGDYGPISASLLTRWFEMGTSRQPAYPFIRPAMDQAAGAVKDAMQAAGEKGLIKELAK